MRYQSREEVYVEMSVFGLMRVRTDLTNILSDQDMMVARSEPSTLSQDDMPGKSARAA